MASLTGTKIKDTYDSLLKVSDNGALDGTLQVITDGLGNNSALSLSTAGASVTGTLSVSGGITGTLSTAAQTNITSVGTLSGLSVNGNGTISNATNPKLEITDTTLPNTLLLQSLNGDSIIGTSTNTSLSIKTNDTTRMTFGNSGDISFRDSSANEAFYWDASAASLGIGTSSPASLMHITGAAATLTLGDSTQSSSSVSTILFKNRDGNGANRDIVKIKGLTGASGGYGNIVFETAFDNSLSERMRINSSGNVGIGTSSPATKLHTVASNATSRTVYLGDAATFVGTGINIASGVNDTAIHFSDNSFIERAAIYTNSSRDMYIKTAGSERMRIDSAGNVGIGTSSPDTRLCVGNGIKIFDSALTDSLTLSCSTSSSYANTITHGDIGLQFNNNTTTRGYSFSTNSVEKVRINQHGLTFNGDNVAANALDDYEEGTWSPVYQPSAGSFATMTMEIITAKYTKIGNMVTLFAAIRTDNVDVTGGSGSVDLGGLPFAVSSTAGGLAIGLSTGFTNAPDAAVFSSSTTTFRLKKTNATIDLLVADLTDGAISNKNELRFTATYFV